LKRKIIFRVDGNANIGLGHLVRCMALAEMLRYDFTIHFICHELHEKTRAMLESVCQELTIIKDETESLAKFIASSDIVVLDGYNFNTDYQKQIKNSGCKLVCIDDLNTGYFLPI
jgi:UDP-2,4-diacetamido-2,4,6-trideoxy-beta-L-altropyranose hydrolase